MFVVCGCVVLVLGDVEVVFLLSYEVFGESAFDGGDAATTTEVFCVNVMVYSVFGNCEVSVLVCVDVLVCGCDVSDGFLEDVVMDARRRREASCDTSFDWFVMFVMCLNCMDEDR